MTLEDHLDNLLRHIERVREACDLLGRRMIQRGRPYFGRMLIARGCVHDASKFHGIEWDFLHAGQDVPHDQQLLAIEHHRRTNDHHPEFWGGLEAMPEIAVAEMVCDWYARSQEFGTDLRRWIADEATPRYNITSASDQATWIQEFLDLVVARPFV
ncbi:MAG: DUF5662 family protein [Gemmataceae bacterium]